MTFLGGVSKKVLLGMVTMLFTQMSWAVISNFTASSDATNISYSFNYTGTPQFIRVYLDTDKSASTGFPMNNIGVDYLIENGDLYKYSGLNGSWKYTYLRSSNMVKTVVSGQPSVQFTIPKSSVGSPSSLIYMANDGSGSVGPLTQSLITSTPTTLPPVTWTSCATEGGACTFTGTRQVRYGANGTFAYRTATGSIACNNATFGDPLIGTVKSCAYSSVVLSNPVTTTTVPPTVTTLPQVPTTTTVPPVTGSMNQVSYSGTSALMPNPERGFFWQNVCSGGLDVNQLRAYRTNNSTTIIRCYWHLTAFKTSLISAAHLQTFQTTMDTIRAAGLKTILLFTYDMNSNIDAAPSLVLQHIDQLAPYFKRNSDVIAALHAGFIGQWGEWDDSVNFGSYNNWTAQNWVDRKAVADRLLLALPPERQIQIRKPAHKMRMYGSAPLTSSEAFTNTAKARVGHENDCFLSSATDYGTYTNKTTDYPWLAQETQFLAMGGETCNPNPPRSQCATALQEMTMFHWSQLHEGYNVNIINGWKTEGCFNEVKARLGYRFVLRNGSFSASAKIAGSINVNFSLVNEGFAATYNPRKVEIILRNNSTGAVYALPMNSDPRRWLPGTTINVSQTLVLPSSIPGGNYSLLLNLPDPAPTLTSRPEYSIQLANANVWEASTGFNRLNSNLVISQ